MYPCKTEVKKYREMKMLRQAGRQVKFEARQAGGSRAGRQAVQLGGKCYAGQKLVNKWELDNFTFYKCLSA